MTIAIHQQGSSLAIQPDQQGFTDPQIAALRQLGVSNASPGDLAVFFHQAQRSGLDPFKREIYMIGRQGKQTIQTGIDGMYKIADRVSRATGGSWGISETYWCGDDGTWRDVWLQEQAPAAAKVVVERNGSRFTTVALTREYKAQGPMWQKMPARMIAKCAEALAIRKAFPEDLSGLYTSDEMGQADRGGERATPAPVTRIEDAVTQEQPAPALRTPAQASKLTRLISEQQLSGAEALPLFSQWIGRSITSTKELTPAEADIVIGHLSEQEAVDPQTGEVLDAEIVPEPDDVDPWAQEVPA